MKENIDIEKILTQSPLGVVVASPAKGVLVQKREHRRVGTVYLVEGQKAVAIKLTMGKHCIVDYADAENMLSYNWFARKHRKRHADIFYAARTLNRHKPGQLAMHQVILGSEAFGDHDNRNGLDNRRCNLRSSSRSQNAANRTPAPSKSGFIGVCKKSNKPKAYQARVGYQNKIISVGYFHSAEEAARARDKAALRIQGEFAMLNFPDK